MWGAEINGAIGCKLADEGTRVAAANLDLQAAEEAAGSVAKAGGGAKPHTTDVRRAAEVAGMVEAAVGVWGDLDILCGNAGFIPSARLEGLSEAAPPHPQQDRLGVHRHHLLDHQTSRFGARTKVLIHELQP